MSDSQTAWLILWKHASEQAIPGSPFEIGDVAPTATSTLKISEDEARRLIGGLLTELDRMPDGRRFFTREGNAVVPLPEFLHALSDTRPPLAVYPYEL